MLVLLRAVCRQLTVVIQQAEAMQKIYDPHLHFFDLSKGKYNWLKAKNPPFWPDKNLIAKNFMPRQLILNSHFTLDGGVHIEAGFDNELPQNEVRWLEKDVYTIEPKFTFKSIASSNIGMSHDLFVKTIDLLEFYKTFVGIRCIIEEDEGLIDKNENILKNVKFLERAGILLEIQFDLCCNEKTRSVLTILKEAPNVTVIINHAGYPPISHVPDQKNAIHSSENSKDTKNHMDVWKLNLALFAQQPNCYIKCSGFEMFRRDYTKQHVVEVIKILNELFGDRRIMFASNFPLTLFSTSYADYWQLLFDCANETQVNSERVMYSNAKLIYG